MHKTRFFPVLLLALIVAAFFCVVPVAAVATAEESLSESMTRGSRFTATITGLPNTTYYIWLPRTFTMSGEQYDMPPVIADNTENFSKDPAGGPYTIGSYQYYNGNGRTILDGEDPARTDHVDHRPGPDKTRHNRDNGCHDNAAADHHPANGHNTRSHADNAAGADRPGNPGRTAGSPRSGCAACSAGLQEKKRVRKGCAFLGKDREVVLERNYVDHGL
jgi:hypothetical protein